MMIGDPLGCIDPALCKKPRSKIFSESWNLAWSWIKLNVSLILLQPEVGSENRWWIGVSHPMIKLCAENCAKISNFKIQAYTVSLIQLQPKAGHKAWWLEILWGVLTQLYAKNRVLKSSQSPEISLNPLNPLNPLNVSLILLQPEVGSENRWRIGVYPSYDQALCRKLCENIEF